MTPEELDEARATEAYRVYGGGTFGNGHTLATIAARIAREQEQERAKVLVEYAEGDANRGDGAGMRATQALAAYKAGKAAR
jgi:hypothetical protein